MPLTYKQICQLTLIILFIMSIIFVFKKLRYRYNRSFEWEQPVAYTRSLDDIQTGDLYLCRDATSNMAKLAIFGAPVTHIGMFHRCEQTNRLFIIEAGGWGLHYETWAKKRKTYPGNLYIRRLRQPLNSEQRIYVQNFIDNVFAKTNLRTDVENLSASQGLEPKLFPFFQLNMNAQQSLIKDPVTENSTKVFLVNCLSRHLLNSTPQPNSTGILCTDFVFAMYQRLQVLDPTLVQSCLEPFWFVDQDNHVMNNAFYSSEILRNYDAEKEHIILENSRINVNDWSI